MPVPKRSDDRWWRFGIAFAILFAASSESKAARWTPLQDARFDDVCIDLDGVKADANGWTTYSQTYCSGQHGGGPAPVLRFAVKCSDFISGGTISLQLYTTKWEPTTVGRVEQLAVQLVCRR